MLLQTWSDVLVQTFQDLWLQIALFAPRLIVSVAFLVVGWIAGSVLGSVVAQVIRGLRIDRALRNIGVEEIVERSGFHLDAGEFVGTLVRWYLMAVFLIASVNILGLSDVNVFLQTVVLGYLPRVIIAAVILLLGAVLGDVVHRVVIGGGRAAGAPSAHFAAGISKWAIWIFSILAALVHLGIATELIQTIVTGVVAMLALAGGLAFGLGGKDAASRYIERLRGEMGGRK